MVRPGEYSVETQFFITKEGWEGGFPVLALPIVVSDTPIHPFFEVEKEGLTWRVDADRQESKPGQGIRLKLTVANVGKEPVTIWWPEQFFDSYFVISDNQGTEVWNNRLPKESGAFEPLWPTAITFPPGQCKLVAQGQWNGKIEIAEEGSEEKKEVDAKPGEYAVKTVRGFRSMPLLEDLKFSLVVP
jgi:hypothetical protein